MNELVKTNIRLSKELKTKIDTIAKEEQLSVNATIVNLIEKALLNTNDIVKNTSNIAQETLEDKIDFLLQQQEKLKKEIKQEMQKEILEDFKIFANVLAKKIQEIFTKSTNYLTIKRPIKFETAKKFAELNKKPFLQKNDLIAAIDVFTNSLELKIYKVLKAESYTNVVIKELNNIEAKEVKIDLTNQEHFLAIVSIFRKI